MKHQDLFNYFYEEHGIMLMENELIHVERLCELSILQQAAERATRPYKESGMTNLAYRARRAILKEGEE